MHNIVGVENLVASAILGADFLHEKRLVLDFSSSPVSVCKINASLSPDPEAVFAINQISPVYETTHALRPRICAVAAIEDAPADIADECAVPLYGQTTCIETPWVLQLSLRS